MLCSWEAALSLTTQIARTWEDGKTQKQVTGLTRQAEILCPEIIRAPGYANRAATALQTPPLIDF